VGSILFAFASAFASALNVVTQHVASTAAPAKDRGWRLAVYLVRNPLWLFGVGAIIGSFVFQAVALYDGRISVVQSILVTELVFSLVIGVIWLHRTVVPTAWLSALVTSAGLALFLVMSEPKGGHPRPTGGAWLPALLTCGTVAAALTLLASRGSPLKRGALYASASGIAAAVLATFLKSATDVLGDNGVVATFKNWTLYALVLTVVVEIVLTQAALHYGPLAVSQPLMVIVNPFVSVILGIWLYGEHFQGGGGKVAVGAIGFAVMVVGVVFLARTAPSLAAAPPTTGPPQPNQEQSTATR
jgi:drug/metabolite transporter (DMT)-like permease